MTTWQDNLRVVDEDDKARAKRPAAQDLSDAAFDGAEDGARQALQAMTDSLDYARSAIHEIPARFRDLPVVLRQWQEHLADKRKLGR